MEIKRLYCDIESLNDASEDEIKFSYYDENKKKIGNMTYTLNDWQSLPNLSSDKVESLYMTDNVNHTILLVQFDNDEYGYVNIDDGKLYNYRFDYATNFDNNGYALVAKNGKVNIMNQEFEVFDVKTDSWIGIEDSINNPNKFIGYDDISWHDENYLAKIWNYTYPNGILRFIDFNGKLKNFNSYSFEEGKEKSVTEFIADFNDHFYENGMMLLLDGTIILANGYYITKDSLPYYIVELSKGKTLSKQVENEISKYKKYTLE